MRSSSFAFREWQKGAFKCNFSIGLLSVASLGATRSPLIHRPSIEVFVRVDIQDQSKLVLVLRAGFAMNAKLPSRPWSRGGCHDRQARTRQGTVVRAADHRCA